MDNAEITKIGAFERDADQIFSLPIAPDAYLQAYQGGLWVKLPSGTQTVSWATLQSLREVVGGQYPLRCVGITGEHRFGGYCGSNSCDVCGKTKRQVLGDFLADKEAEAIQRENERQEGLRKARQEQMAANVAHKWPAMVGLKGAEELKRKLDQEAWDTVLKAADSVRPPSPPSRAEILRQMEDRGVTAKLDQMRQYGTFELETIHPRGQEAQNSAEFWYGFWSGILVFALVVAAGIVFVYPEVGMWDESKKHQPTRRPDHVVSFGESVAEVPDR